MKVVIDMNHRTYCNTGNPFGLWEKHAYAADSLCNFMTYEAGRWRTMRSNMDFRNWIW